MLWLLFPKKPERLSPALLRSLALAERGVVGRRAWARRFKSRVPKINRGSSCERFLDCGGRLLRAYGSSGSPTGVMAPGGVWLSVVTFLGDAGWLAGRSWVSTAKNWSRGWLPSDWRLTEGSLCLVDNRSFEDGREGGRDEGALRGILFLSVADAGGEVSGVISVDC